MSLNPHAIAVEGVGYTPLLMAVLGLAETGTGGLPIFLGLEQVLVQYVGPALVTSVRIGDDVCY